MGKRNLRMFVAVSLMLLLMGMNILKWTWTAFWTSLNPEFNALAIIEPPWVYLCEVGLVAGCMLVVFFFLIKTVGGRNGTN